MKKKHDFGSVRALVVGLAREGTALARFLVERGARVAVTDLKPAEALAENVAALADLPLTWSLGGHPPALLDEADVLFVSPGVPLGIPFLAEARRRGLPLSSEVRLFTRLCPAPIVGVTGSSGKTTTTALVGEMLRAAGRQTWIGGNIGQPLIGCLDEIAESDAVVMELSSFQLEFFGEWGDGYRGIGESGEQGSGKSHYKGRKGTASPDFPLPQGERVGVREDRIFSAGLGCGERARALFDPAGWSPAVAAVLNVTPNHLDRHPSMAAYIAAKEQILNYQQPGDTAILNLDNPVTRQMGRSPSAIRHSPFAVRWFSLEQEVDQGAFLRGEGLVLRWQGRETVLCHADELQLLGRHNVANALAASLVARSAGAPLEALRRVLTTFRGVAHRLEWVRERGGVRWYNDSIATTPERIVAALRAFDAPILLLAGGRDKHLPWEEMAALTWQKVRHLILFGEAANLIEGAMHQARTPDTRYPIPDAQPATHIHHAGTLERAVEMAAQAANPGDVVLLSPGGASFDAYRDYEARGERFRQLVGELE